MNGQQPTDHRDVPQRMGWLHEEAHKAGLCKCLPKVDLTGPRAFDAIGNWIAASPAARSCWAIDKINGQWRVGLQQDGERLSAGVGKTLAEAAENAIKIAAAAGCL